MATFKGYRISSAYGYRTHPIKGTREFHAGIDLVKAHQSPIYSFTAGTVVYAGFGQSGTGFGGYGNVVYVKDNNNHGQLYAHLDSVTVKRGQHIRVNQLIGYQGKTGYVTGSHLHFEVRQKAETTVPYGYRANKQSSTLNPTSYILQYNEKKPIPPTYLKKGARGTEVKRLQHDLIRLGYKLPKYGADGVFGTETLVALQAFQREQGLKVDGIVGPNTKNKWVKATKLIAKYPGYYIKKGSKGEIVRIIQRKLAIAVDGIFGVQTENAVKNFQRKNKVQADGIVGPVTWSKLF